jgi:hypothetical protein
LNVAAPALNSILLAAGINAFQYQIELKLVVDNSGSPASELANAPLPPSLNVTPLRVQPVTG